MKIKRIHIVRPEVEIHFEKPVLGRLYFYLFVLPRMFMIKKAKICAQLKTMWKSFDTMKPIPLYFISIPKIKVGGAGD